MMAIKFEVPKEMPEPPVDAHKSALCYRIDAMAAQTYHRLTSLARNGQVNSHVRKALRCMQES